MLGMWELEGGQLHLLLLLDDVFDEEVVQQLVRVVDAQLREEVAALKVLERIGGLFDLKQHHQIGLITCDASGKYATVALRDGFRAVVGDAEGVRVIEPDHVFYAGT